MFKERCIQLICLEEALKRDVYLMCHNSNAMSGIDGSMIDVLREMLRFSKRRDKAAIIIQTPGGSLDSVCYICDLFREYYKGVDTYIAGDCYSGGTMIALASDNIYMSKNACLGPIDIQNNVNKGENLWMPDLYGKVSALVKAVKLGDATHEIVKAFEKNESVLAMYFKMKYTYKELIGNHVKKHCKNEEEWEKVWEYLAELNLSHGNPITYNKCVELGLDVKRMSKNIEAMVSKIVRDANNEFGGLVSKSILCDFYENTNTVVLSKSEIRTEEAVGEIMTIKSTELLGIIESVQVGYMQETESAVTLYNTIPVKVLPIRDGWKEEYNVSLILPEQNEFFETQLDYMVEASLKEMGMETAEADSNMRANIRKVIEKEFYDQIIEALKKEGADIDAMSSAERWKAVVEYCENMAVEEEEDELGKLEPVFRREAKANNIDYDNLTEDAKRRFVELVLMSRVPQVVEFLKTTFEEFLQLDEEEQYSMVVEYMKECE